MSVSFGRWGFKSPLAHHLTGHVPRNRVLMLVDSYRFLPRHYRAMYEAVEPVDSDPVWAPFEARLAEAKVALLTSAGLYLHGSQEPFDLERERRQPTWGDPSHRVLPSTAAQQDVGMAHLHINNDGILADVNVALPVDRLRELAEDGMVGEAAPEHLSVMGYQEAGLQAWRDETGPAIVELLRSQRTDGLILAPV